MKEYVNSQNFISITEVMDVVKQMFGDVPQKVMEGELDTQFGYEKSKRIAGDDEKAVSKNYRNGYSQKTIKSRLGEIQVKIPRGCNGEYEPQIIGKYDRNVRVQRTARKPGGSLYSGRDSNGGGNESKSEHLFYYNGLLVLYLSKLYITGHLIKI